MWSPTLLSSGERTVCFGLKVWVVLGTLASCRRIDIVLPGGSTSQAVQRNGVIDRLSSCCCCFSHHGFLSVHPDHSTPESPAWHLSQASSSWFFASARDGPLARLRGVVEAAGFVPTGEMVADCARCGCPVAEFADLIQVTSTTVRRWE